MWSGGIKWGVKIINLSAEVKMTMVFEYFF